MTSSFLGGIVTHPPPLVIIRDITNFATKQRIQMANGSFPHCQTVHSVWPWFYLNGNGLIGFQDSLGAGMQPQSLMHSHLKDNISAASHTNGDDEEVAK